MKHEVQSVKFDNLPYEVIWDSVSKSFSFGKCVGSHLNLENAQTTNCAGTPADGTPLAIVVVAMSDGVMNMDTTFTVTVKSVCTAGTAAHTLTAKAGQSA
jgi:hypothetical protein